MAAKVAAMHLHTSEAATVVASLARQSADACGGGDRSPAPLDSLRLRPEDVPLDGPPVEWFMAVAPAVAALGRIAARYLPDVAAHHVPPECESVMGELQALGRDAAASSFQAAWDDLCSSEDGRAVVAVCDVAMDVGMMLGGCYTESLAADAGLEDKLRELYVDKAFLPVLLAAARCYRAQAASDAGAAAAAAGSAGGR